MARLWYFDKYFSSQNSLVQFKNISNNHGIFSFNVVKRNRHTILLLFDLLEKTNRKQFGI